MVNKLVVILINNINIFIILFIRKYFCPLFNFKGLQRFISVLANALQTLTVYNYRKRRRNRRRVLAESASESVPEPRDQGGGGRRRGIPCQVSPSLMQLSQFQDCRRHPGIWMHLMEFLGGHPGN